MDIEKLFNFLINDYGLTYKHQEIDNCYGKWNVETHSFYNDSGCFTIYIEIQRGMDFWFASKFSSNYEELCEREIDISIIEPEIWGRQEKILFLKWPFFWWNNDKVLSTLAKVLKIHLKKSNEFFGIQV